MKLTSINAPPGGKDNSLKRKLLLFTGFLLALIIFIAIAYVFKISRDEPRVFSDHMVLDSLWEFYKREFIEPVSGRTIDFSRGEITTSEGQSYTMLRAVWMGDKETFDTSWRWAKDILYRQEDRLFAWLFGPRPDGTYGVRRDEGGYNTASDADIDIALALLLAYSRWQDDSYFFEARDIIRDIWEEEVVIVAGRPYLASNNLEKDLDSDFVLINPSYFSPHAFRIFARVDSEHDWLALVESSYDLLSESITDPLGEESPGVLPPDWVNLDRTTGEIRPVETNRDLGTTYGFEAMRIPLRLALAWKWFGDMRARELLEEMNFLEKEWDDRGRLGSVYAHDGEVVDERESLAMYGGSLGYFAVIAPDKAREIYKEKLLAAYDPDTSNWRRDADVGYYEANLAWFGMAFYNDMLINLTEL